MIDSKNRKYLLLVFVGIFLAFYYAWLFLFRDINPQFLVYGNFLSAFAVLLSAIMLISAVRKCNPAERLFWVFLLLGTISYLVGDIIWIVYENLLQMEVPFPGYPDLFYMLQIVFYFWAIAYLLVKINQFHHAVKFIFDTAIIMTVASTFSWHFIIKPILAFPETSGMFLFFSLGYPVCDLGLLFGAMAIYFGVGDTFLRKGLHLFLIGIFVQILADSIYLYLLATDSYISGSIVDPIYALALLLIGTSGIFNQKLEIDLTAGKPIYRTGKWEHVRMYFPYVSLIILFLFLLQTNNEDPVFQIGAGIAVILLIVRQLVVLTENRRLIHKYEERTLELAINEQKFRSLIDFHSDAVFSVDLSDRFTSVNDSFCKMLGVNKAKLLGNSIFSFVNEPNIEVVTRCLEKTKKGEPLNVVLEVTGSKGIKRHVSFSTVPMFVNNKVEGVYGIGKDITDEKKTEDKITYMAYHDLLTELPNRSYFEKVLNETLREKSEERHAVIFIDLDRFKVINDTLGHQIGDQLLISAAKRLRESLSLNGIIARQGGDEFTLLAKSISNRKEAAAIAEKIISEINRPFLVNGHDLRVTASIGIAIYPEDGESVVELMKHADMSMYEAKENGKNGYSYYISELNEEPSRKLVLEKDLHFAIENKELMLYYQPQIDTKSNKVTGAEALVRWNHPSFGVISPAEFIPIAEQSGLIIPIGEWILRTACEQGRIWHEQGYSLKIGVNLSPRQFYQDNLLRKVEDVLVETGIPPEHLDLEITEGIAMNDLDLVVPNLYNLRKLGVKVSIDDFGTGYSSLSYLSSIPIDTLKIAREFVDKVGIDKGNEAIIASIVAMAKNLNLDVIAEGVETESQSLFLQNLNCTLMQGYWYSKPLPVNKVNELLQEQDMILLQ